MVNDPCRCASALGFSGSPPRPTPHPRRYPACHNRTTEILPDGSLKDSDAHETLSNAGFPGFRGLADEQIFAGDGNRSLCVPTSARESTWQIQHGGKLFHDDGMGFTVRARVGVALADAGRWRQVLHGDPRRWKSNVSDAASLYCLMKHIS